MTHPFVSSSFAAARAHLLRARTAQINAILWSQGVYAAGYKGSTSRRMVKYWHEKRDLFIREALRERANAKDLRKLAKAPARLQLVGAV